jgi:hypothetical protein
MDRTGETNWPILAGDEDTLGCNVKTSSYSCHLWMEKVMVGKSIFRGRSQLIGFFISLGYLFHSGHTIRRLYFLSILEG